MGTGTDLWNQFETLSNKHDWTGVASMFATNGAHVDPNGRREGREAIVAYLEEAERAFAEQTTHASLAVEEGDIVVAEWMSRITHTGPMPMPDGTEVPATGKTLEVPGVSVMEISEGKIANLRDYFDLVAMMTQLGLMPGN